MEIPRKQKRLLQRSIALTLTCGVLLAGSAGMAYAAATPDGSEASHWTETVSIGEGTTWSVSSLFPINEKEGHNIATKSLTLNGGTLNLSNGGRLVGWGTGLDFQMKGGTLSLDGSSSAPVTIDAARVNISGGTVTLTGKDGSAWEKGAYIGGYDGLMVSGKATEITMNANSLLFIGKYEEADGSTEMKLSGGTINLLGSKTGDGYGNDAAHIWASSSGYPSTVALTMDGAKLVVGDGSSEKYGIISADNATLSAGSITVKKNGHLLLQPNAGSKQVTAADGSVTTQSNVVYAGDLSGKMHMTGGEFTVDKGGHVSLGSNFDIVQTGGTMTVNGSMYHYDDANANSEYIIKDGSTVNVGTGDAAYGLLHAGKLTIEGGTINVGNTNTAAWGDASSLGGYGYDSVTTVSGGTINLKDSGALFAGAQDWNTAKPTELNISGGTINMQGTTADKASVIAATSDGKTWNPENTETDHVVLNISDKAEINVAKNAHGYISSRETNMTGGTIKLDEGANLIVAGVIAQRDGSKNPLTAKGGLEEVNKDGSDYIQGGEFTLKGGAINVGKSGTLDFASGAVEFTMEGGEIKADTTSLVKFDDFTYDGGTWGLGDTLTILGEYPNDFDKTSGLYAKGFIVGADLSLKEITSAGELTIDDGALQIKKLTQKDDEIWVDSASLVVDDLAQEGGSIKVDGKGSLTVGKLAQTGGTITVGGYGAGTLKVTGSLQNLAYDDSTPAGIKLDNLGTLEIGADKVLNGTSLASGVGKLGVLAGSTVKLTGLDGKELTTGDVTAIQTALATNFNGLLDLGSAKIDVQKNDDGTVDYVAGVTNESLKTETVKVNGTTAGTGIGGGFKDIVVNDAATTEVKADGTLKLVGSADGGALLQNTKKDKPLDLTAKDGAVVILGDKEANNKGTVGNVALGSSGEATLNAVGNGEASFTAGAITKGGTTANVVVEGATLNAKSVGAAGTEITTINLNNDAALQASGDVHVGRVSGNGGTLAGKNVTVTAGADISNGTIQATDGDVALTSGVSGMSGNIVSDKKDINAAGQSIAVAAEEGATLHLKAEAGAIKAENITATSVTAKTLTATGNVALAGEGSALNLAEASTVTGALNLTGTDATIAKSLEVTGAATIDGGTLKTEKDGTLTFKADATLQGGAQVNVDKLVLAAAAGGGGGTNTLFVGSDEAGAGGATLVAKTLQLNGGNLIVDPEWKDVQGNPIGASVAAVESIGGSSADPEIVLDGSVGVGRNAMLTFGTNDETWLFGQVNDLTGGKGLTEDGITAAFGLTKHLDMNSNSLIVDGGKMTAGLQADLAGGNTIKFASGSLLVVDDKAFDGANGAIEGVTTATVGADAKLRITNAKLGTSDAEKTYQVFKTGITPTIAAGAWADGNLSTDSKLIQLESKGDGKFATSQVFAKDIYKNLTPSLQNTLDTMIGQNLKDTESAQGGIRFLSRATAVGSYLDGNVRLAETTIEGAARMAALGGVPQMTMTALDASRNAIDARTSFASADQGRLTLLNDNAEESGGALWMMPIYQKVKTDDLDAGHYGYDVDGHLTGAAFGYDYTNSGTNRTGLTFSFGSGSADSTGVAYTDNDLDYWGLGLYSSWQHDNFNLVADLSYAKTKSDLTQSLSSAMDMGQLKADDVSGKALSFGLRGEYKYQNGDADIIPHFGIRYTKLDTDSYSAYSTKDRAAVLHAGDSSQKIWTFPIGVTFTKTIEQKSGWTCKPVFDLSLIPASGDLDADSVVRFTGVNSNALVSTEVMGDFSYKGTLGVEFGKDNLSYGIGYSIQASSEMTNHTVYGMVRYAF